MKYRTFNEMENFRMDQLQAVRDELREQLAEEIAKENQIKAEILWLQDEISKFGS